MARITELYLCNVPLENDYKHTIYFDNKDSQLSYFKGMQKYHFPDLSYQRKDSFIRVPLVYDDCIGVNYVVYRNSDYTNKWYYAFIKDIEYENDDVTKVYIETDVIQTWLFDYQVKPSFIEREHVNNDRVGANTIPEGLELGEYVVNQKIEKRGLKIFGYVIGSTVDLEKYNEENKEDRFPPVVGGIYNGIYSGVAYFKYGNAEDMNVRLKALADAGKSDAIVSIFCVPSLYIGSIGYNRVENSLDPYKTPWAQILDVENPDITPVKPSTINGYTPRNNKLKTYPYQYLHASNNSGSSAIYHYELFSTNETDFTIVSSLTPGMSIRLIPNDYNGCEENNECGLNLGKFPCCSWNNDVYTNWLTQNAINIGNSLATDMLKVGGGIVTAGMSGGLAGGVGMGTAVSGATGIVNTIGQIYQHSLVPPQAEGNLNSGDVTFSNKTLTFTLYQMSIKNEYAKVIDEYFDMFGYKVCRVKTPNIRHRSRYWYTKTIDVNIDGAIPMKDMKIIKDCYNNGITFWRNANEIGNYSLSNNIV